jgi:hypothetical protein
VSCQQCERYLLYYLLGELSPRERLRMERHIPDCVTCSEEMKVLARDLTLISEAVATRASAPEEVLIGVRRSVAQHPPPRAARRWLSTRVHPAQAIGVALAIVTVSLVTWFVSKPELGAATITHPALMSDRQDFLTNCGIAGLTRGTPADAAKALTPDVDAEVAPVRISDDGFHFCGYLRRSIRGCHVALLVFGDRSGRDCISVYEYAHRRCALARDLGERRYHGKIYRMGAVNGVATVAWQRGATTIALVAERSLEDTLAWAEAARNSVPERPPSPTARL